MGDTYVANHDFRLNAARPAAPRVANPRKYAQAHGRPQQSWRSHSGQPSVPLRPQFESGRGTGYKGQSFRSRRECFKCGSLSHMSFNCPQNNSPSYHGGNQRLRNPNKGSDKTQVNACTVAPQATPESQPAPESQVVQGNKVEVMSESTWEYTEYPEVDTVKAESPSEDGVLKIHSLEFVEIMVEGLPAKAVIDSGSEIPVVSQEIIEKHQIETFGGVTIQGVNELARIRLVTLGIQIATQDSS